VPVKSAHDSPDVFAEIAKSRRNGSHRFDDVFFVGAPVSAKVILREACRGGGCVFFYGEKRWILAEV